MSNVELRSSKSLKVVNLLGAPGMGKSAVAAGVFNLMKKKHHSVELCREYAKYLVIAGREWQLREEQLYLFAKQHHELFILRGKYEVAITDSPLLLTAFYAAPDVTPPSFFQCVKDYNATFDNLYFFITRDLASTDTVFEEEGRIHNRVEAMDIEAKQRAFLKEWNIPYIDIVLTEDKDEKLEIYNHILNHAQ